MYVDELNFFPAVKSYPVCQIFFDSNRTLTLNLILIFDCCPLSTVNVLPPDENNKNSGQVSV
jgi:hypothetical protein